MLTITPITKQYVTIDVASALASGAPAVISGVDVALVQPRSAPVGTTAWTSAAYASGTATVLVAGYDADPTGALVIPAGWGADLWIRVVDSPEVTATRVTRVLVEPGTDGLPAAVSTTPYVQTIAGLSGIVSGPALMTALGSSLTAAIDAEIAAAGAAGLTVAATIATAGALVAGKHNPVNATSGAKAMTLPTGTSGKLLSVEKADATTNAVTISGNIRGVGSSTISLVWQNEDLLFASDSAGSWWPIAGHKTKAALDAAYGRFVVGTTHPSTPSGEYVWFQTDGSGTLIDIFTGVNP